MSTKEYSILIVEDEFIALEYLTQILTSLRIKKIFKASSAKEALEIVNLHSIHLVFMDINIQGPIDGIECAHLLNKVYFLPIIFTTAYGDTNTINEAKEENTFGYLVKPFQSSNVEAALQVALMNINRIKEFQNTQKRANSLVEIIDLKENYRYHTKSKTVKVNGIPIILTKKELEMLDVFCHNINNNITYKHIKELVWQEQDVSDSTVRDIISRLKKKIPTLQIENISNYGYILKQVKES